MNPSIKFTPIPTVQVSLTEDELTLILAALEVRKAQDFHDLAAGGNTLKARVAAQSYQNTTALLAALRPSMEKFR